MSTTARIAKNTAALAGGSLITKFLSLAFLVYVARRLGDIGFGEFSTAMALVGLVSVLPNYIARPYLIREAARARGKVSELLAQVTLINIALSAVVFGGLYLLAPHLGYDPVTVQAILILGFALVFDATTASYHAVLAGFERMELSALLNIANTAITVIIGGVVLWLGYGLVALVAAYAVAKAVTLALALVMLARVNAGHGLRPDPALMRVLFAGAWPFFITTVFVMIYQRLDVVILSFFRDPAEVGYYNAAYKVMEGMGLLTASFVTAVYPVLARLFVDRPDQLRVVYRRALRYLLAFVLPAAVGLALVAADLMPALFGAEFAPAAAALAILVWGQAVDSVNPLLAQALRATDRERSLAVITGIGAAFNCVANLILIPPFGLYGAAIATVASFGLLLVINQWALTRAIGGPNILEPLLRTLGATGVMAAAIVALSRFAVPQGGAALRLTVMIGGGVLAYLVGAWMLRVLDHEDRALLLSVAARRLRRNGGA